jgi:uncharacterized protein YndB with AHSA1/START domain
MTDKKPDSRTFEMTIDIQASPDDVWRALTQSEELVRWFPLGASVTPGPGGTMRWSWGDGWSGDARIDIWEPLRRLRLVEDRRQSYDADGHLQEGAPPSSTPLAIELTLETHQGQTRLRLVHSGFESGAGWDDEFDGISTGWQYELRSLRHYLQRHRGYDRNVGWARTSTSSPASEVWARLLGPEGFAVAPERPGTGDPVHVTGAGENFRGTVLLSLPEGELSIIVDDLDAGVLRLSTHRAAGHTGVSVWLATYRASDIARVNAFAETAQALLHELFP